MPPAAFSSWPGLNVNSFSGGQIDGCVFLFFFPFSSFFLLFFSHWGFLFTHCCVRISELSTSMAVKLSASLFRPQSCGKFFVVSESVVLECKFRTLFGLTLVRCPQWHVWTFDWQKTLSFMTAVRFLFSANVPPLKIQAFVFNAVCLLNCAVSAVEKKVLKFPFSMFLRPTGWKRKDGVC